MQTTYSSTQAIEATDQAWRDMVDCVNKHKGEHGRGFMYFQQSSGIFGYMRLFDIQSKTAEELELNPDIRRQLIELVASGYDFQNEFILVSEMDNETPTRYVLQTGELRHDGRRGVKTDDEIKQKERNDQLMIARQVRAASKMQRKSKKKK
jgi:hypothetical protein